MASLHLLDATYELFRAFFAMPAERAPDGREVGAIRGLIGSTLALLREPDAYDRLEATSSAVAAGLERPGVTVNRVGAMLTGFFAEGPVTDFPAAMASDTDRYARFHAHMLERGVYLAPSQFEAMMPSLAHTAEQVEITAAAAREFDG